MSGVIQLLSKPVVNANTVVCQGQSPILTNYSPSCNMDLPSVHQQTARNNHCADIIKQKQVQTETDGQADRKGVREKDREMPWTKK